MSACSMDGRMGPGRSCRNRSTPQHKDGRSSCSRSEKQTHLCSIREKCPEGLNTKPVEEETPDQHQPAVEHLNLQRSHHDTHQECPDLQKTHEMSNCKNAEEGMWHGLAQRTAVHVPLFSMASISLVRRGGAVSGGPNCSAKSGNTKPERRTQYTEAQSNKY